MSERGEAEASPQMGEYWNTRDPLADVITSRLCALPQRTLVGVMALDTFASSRLLSQHPAPHDARLEALRLLINRKHVLHLSAYFIDQLFV